MNNKQKLMFRSKWPLLCDYCRKGLDVLLKKRRCIQVLALTVPCSLRVEWAWS